METHILTTCVKKLFGGEVIHQDIIELDDREIYVTILDNPSKEIVLGSSQIDIQEEMDAGNHCLSKCSILYEGGKAVINWSNYGHI